MKPNPPPQVLLIERDPDTRASLERALREGGYEVVLAHDARSGLEQLHRAQVNVIVAGDGPALEGAEGRAQRILSRIPTVKLTDGGGEGGRYERALARPLEIERLLAAVASLMPPPDEGLPLRDGPPEPLQLVLYITSDSIASMRALANVRRALREGGMVRADLTVVNLSAGSTQGLADRVLFTPTLVRRGAGAQWWVVGSLDDPETLHKLLRG